MILPLSCHDAILIELGSRRWLPSSALLNQSSARDCEQWHTTFHTPVTYLRCTYVLDAITVLAGSTGYEAPINSSCSITGGRRHERPRRTRTSLNDMGDPARRVVAGKVFKLERHRANARDAELIHVLRITCRKACPAAGDVQAVAEAECNTVTGLKQVHHAATPLPLS